MGIATHNCGICNPLQDSNRPDHLPSALGKTLAALSKQYCRLSVIVNGSLDVPRNAARMIASGDADVVALGKPALANRDWPMRVRTGQPLSADVPASLFGPIADVKDWEIADPRIMD